MADTADPFGLHTDPVLPPLIDLGGSFVIEAVNLICSIWRCSMAATNKSFDSPEETRNVEKGKVEVLNLGGSQVMRATFQPGWKWSECVKPIAGTDSCQVSHLIYTIAGRMVVRMDDGSEIEVKPGDAKAIPSGHDAWIVGDEPYVGVAFQGRTQYAKAQSQKSCRASWFYERPAPNFAFAEPGTLASRTGSGGK